jgi:hypothetical protein
MSKTVRMGLFPALCVAIVLGACAPVSYHRDDAVAIRPGATVALGGGKWDYAEDLDPAVDDDAVHRRIQESIRAELRSAGYAWSGQPESADFLLHYFVALRREVPPAPAAGSLARTTPTARPGWGWGWSGGTVTTITPQDFAKDSFVVELVERSTGAVAWRAVWRGEPSSRAPSREEIDEKMSQLFRSLPAPG